MKRHRFSLIPLPPLSLGQAANLVLLRVGDRNGSTPIAIEETWVDGRRFSPA